MSGQGKIEFRNELKRLISASIDEMDAMLFLSKSAKDNSITLNVFPPEKLFEMLLPITGTQDEYTSWLTGVLLDVVRELSFQDAEVFQSLKSIVKEVEENVDISLKEIVKKNK